MGDTANELGKLLKQQGTDSSDALKRYMPKPKKVERVRDIFDPLVPFEMMFDTNHNETTVLLNLFFNKPPPTSCCSNNLCSACEVFADGNEAIQLERGYIEDSVIVFINAVRRTTFTQTNPATGIVTLTTTVTTSDIVRVCYVYSLEA